MIYLSKKFYNYGSFPIIHRKSLFVNINMLEYERIISFCEFFTIKHMLTIGNEYDIIGKDGYLLQNGVDKRLFVALLFD